ncbi:MAG TPA: divalent-cation tolerance protein CutA [Vicinamibacteria bacterium]|nr:divalent-cation tolerance protein CutA [Vicinamibacteria bacterium]
MADRLCYRARRTPLMSYLLVLTTVGNEEDAARLARSLVEKRLAACVNVLGPVRSFFVWKGKLEDDSERLLLMKTRSDRYPELEAALRELHPYQVPEVIAIPVERGWQAYLSWIDENVGV